MEIKIVGFFFLSLWICESIQSLRRGNGVASSPFPRGK